MAMDPLLREMTDESVALIKKLLMLMEADQNDMKGCINGEVLDSYNRASREVIAIAEEIQKDLMILQAGQRPGL